MQADSKEKTIVISEASTQRVTSLYDRIGFVNVKGQAIEAGAGSFPVFEWQNMSEPDGTPAARDHLKRWLVDHVVEFDADFQIVDVHRSRSVLNFEDKNIGKISGGTDIVIAPKNTAMSSLHKELCVVIELKTSEQIRVHKITHFAASAQVEFVAANCLSYQPGILEILTDLNSGAMAWCSSYNSENDTMRVEEFELTMDQLGWLLCKFLAEQTVRQPDFVPNPSSAEPSGRRHLLIKRKFADMSDVLSQFADMAEGTDDWSRDRAAATWNLLQNCGVERMPTVLHYQMYV
jgi:hypothetical protein